MHTLARAACKGRRNAEHGARENVAAGDFGSRAQYIELVALPAAVRRQVGERERGLTPLEAIREACLLRFRPIMMTTMAALLAGLPLMFGNGTGSELRQPLGYSIVGGLILSQSLTLYTTPVVFLYLDRVNRWLSSLRRAPQTVAADEQPAE